jgi:hypothetical protein
MFLCQTNEASLKLKQKSLLVSALLELNFPNGILNLLVKAEFQYFGTIKAYGSFHNFGADSSEIMK